MADNSDTDLADLLHSRGVRKKLAKQIGALDGNKRRSGAKGEARARQAVKDLAAASEDIRERVLSGDPKRRAASRKAGRTRKRAAATRRKSAKKGARTRAKVNKVRAASR